MLSPMTLAAGAVISASFAHNGTANSYPLTGLSFREAADLYVLHQATVGGLVTQLIAGVTFTTRGNTVSGKGALVLQGATLPSGIITVRRRTPARQTHVFSQGKANNWADFEAACDDLARQTADAGGDVADILARAVMVPPLSGTTAQALATEIVTYNARDLGVAAVNPSTRRDGSALVAGDFFFYTLTNERRYWTGTAFVSGTLPNSVASNVIASNPVMASVVTGDVNGVQVGFTPQLPVTIPRFFRYASLGVNTANPAMFVDGAAGKLLFNGDGTQIAAGQLGPAGFIHECIELSDRVVVLNPRAGNGTFVPAWRNDAGSSIASVSTPNFGHFRIREGWCDFTLQISTAVFPGFLTSVTQVAIGGLPAVARAVPSVASYKYPVNVTADNFKNEGTADPFLAHMFGVVIEGDDFVRLYKRRSVDGVVSRAVAQDFWPYSGAEPLVYINGSYPI